MANCEGCGQQRVSSVLPCFAASAWTNSDFSPQLRGRTLSLDFLRRPSKRLYPDYYKLIQRPIALEEIKKQLEHGAYPSLEAVKSDFELCFHNAKQYNMKDSEIWRDAKDLLVGIDLS